MRSWWISIALVAACGGSTKTATPMPEGPSCTTAAQHMADELAAGKDPRPSDETINALIELIQNRCEQDAWSADAQRCLAEMKSAEDANRCAGMLTEAQQAALVRDQEASAGRKEPELDDRAAPPPPPTPAAAPAPSPAVPATRGPQRKGSGRTEDPDQGGE